jgi:hypothetical protein
MKFAAETGAGKTPRYHGGVLPDTTCRLVVTDIAVIGW